jgi:hypothetical protein
MDTLYLKPRAGLTVRDQRTAKPMPEYGQAVPNVSYWRRRLKDGDVTPTTAEAVAKGAKAEQAKAVKAAETTKEG